MGAINRRARAGREFGGQRKGAHADSAHAAALVAAAARALGCTGDAALGQLGGAVAHNLAIHVEADVAGAHATPLLTAALGALPKGPFLSTKRQGQNGSAAAMRASLPAEYTWMLGAHKL